MNVLITKYLCTSLINFICQISEVGLLDQRLYLFTLLPAMSEGGYSLEIIPILSIIIQYIYLFIWKEILFLFYFVFL